MKQFTLTHFLLAAILIVLSIGVSRRDLVPVAHAAAVGEAIRIEGCHRSSGWSGCRWIPIAVDADGRVMTSTR